MGNKVYSEKEIAIFNGVIALMEKGVNPYSIKVSDIAREADVGKGTIYDYFTSKEEAISQAILYNIKIEIESAYSRIRAKAGFREKFFEILYIMAECVDSNVSTFSSLLSAGGIQEFYEYLSEYRYDLSDHLSRIYELYEHLLDTGVKEGIVEKVENSYYRNMVFSSAIVGFSQYFGHRNFNNDISIEEAMEASYKLLVKGLN